MSVILNGAVRLYYYLNDDIADPRTQDWFLMKSPWIGLGIIVVYLMSVLKWIPAYMKNKPAYELREIILLFNILQIIGCGYVFYQSLTLAWFNDYKLICQPSDNSGPYNLDIAWKVCYTYFVLKLLDLLDTVFFVLRKKENQVSFLHVYHHFGMVALSWGMVKWLPGGHGLLLVTVNSLVHVIMYTYYLLTVWDSSYKKSIWWKKHVTQIQIFQFTLLLFHFIAVVMVKDCAFPKQPAYILIPQNLFMVILFGEFYYRTYIKTKSE